MSAPPAPSESRRLYWRPIRIVQARPRLFISCACGILIGFLLPHDTRLVTRALIGWNAGLWLYFVLVGVMITMDSKEVVMRRAALQDDWRFAILILATLAAFAAFGGIFAELTIVKDSTGVMKALHICLAAATIVSAWTFIHVMFAPCTMRMNIFPSASQRVRTPQNRTPLSDFQEPASPTISTFSTSHS